MGGRKCSARGRGVVAGPRVAEEHARLAVLTSRWRPGRSSPGAIGLLLGMPAATWRPVVSHPPFVFTGPAIEGPNGGPALDDVLRADESDAATTGTGCLVSHLSGSIARNGRPGRNASEHVEPIPIASTVDRGLTEVGGCSTISNGGR
jgi:hypothetical protein